MTDAISSILSQIRAHEMRMRGPDAAPGNAIDSVSRAQNTSGALQQAFELGDPRADLARVMVAMQQSQVAFRATVEVRNRLVQAYQDVMNMPV